MHNFSKSIDLLFRRVSPGDILARFFNIDIEHAPLSENIDKQMFSDLAVSRLSPQFTYDEIDVLFEALKDKWMDRDDGSESEKKKSVFYLLLDFGRNTLVEKDGEPLCRYRRLLEWNDLSRKLGENIFTTAFLAYKDYKALRERFYFSWPPIISTNNTRLKLLLDKGLAENHFHLKGSAPHFSLSWISLMNRFKNRREGFELLEKQARLEPEIVSRFRIEIPGLYTLVKKAAYIRAFLFSRLMGYWEEEPPSSCGPRRPKNMLDDGWLDLLKPGNDEEFIIYTHRIQNEVEALRHWYGKTFDNSVPDYAIPKNLVSANYNGNTLLVGERFFMYSMFKEIFASGHGTEGPAKYRELFYAYLVIKEKLRQEFVQVNERSGFKNFEKYQDRKEIFIPGGSIYEKALYYMAVNTSMKNQNIVSFETRISPGSSKVELGKTIKKIDDYLAADVFDEPDFNRVDNYLSSKKRSHKEREEENCCKKKTLLDIQFYTVHFIKWPGADINDQEEEKLSLLPRDNERREWAKQEAFTIVDLRKSMSKEASRIRGIDAASAEIGYRPEIFAQAFRFLKDHSPGGRYDLFKGEIKNRIEKLGATYHVGEDFLDLADGLRAIDEAVKFLSLTRGDRLGHALALGIDPFDYYDLKQYRVMLPKQDLLDNIVWMLSRIEKYGKGEFSQLVYRLEKRYYRLFSELYLNYMPNIGKTTHDPVCPPSMYYDAWRLRGDNPMLYFTGEYKPVNTAITYWQRCARNHTYPNPKDGDIRHDKNIACLYHEYHFNARTKQKGAEQDEFEIEKNYARAVAMIQEEMQKEIRDRGIGIETNPSSNYLIGCFRDYRKHPIINFYNLGLTTDPEKINNCTQLFVSINTDDQGVFNTYLEKEYALMALALEKEEDQKGNKIYNSAMIYDWLDRIRQMGLEQSFK